MIDTYNPTDLPKDKLASITVELQDVSVISTFDGKKQVVAVISSIKNIDGVEVISTGYQGAPNIAYLTEGKYKASIKCSSQGVYNDHILEIYLEKGKKYKAYCLAQYKKVAIFGDTVQAMAAFIDPVDSLETNVLINQKIVNSMPKQY